MAINIRFIKNEEGIRLNEYLCGASKRTIGFGHACAPTEHYPNGITEAKAEELLKADLAGALVHVKKATQHLNINDNQLTALVSLVFNCGHSPLTQGSPGRHLKEGNLTACADSLLAWRHAHGRGRPCNSSCDGLLSRRKRERALMLTPIKPTEPAK
jgi:lysozyme